MRINLSRNRIITGGLTTVGCLSGVALIVLVAAGRHAATADAESDRVTGSVPATVAADGCPRLFQPIGRVAPIPLDAGQGNFADAPQQPDPVQACQMLRPTGGSCPTATPPRGAGNHWEAARAMAWQAFAQGQYVVQARTQHVAEYRLRVDDQLDLVYRVTREETSRPYRLNVGDEVRVESFTDNALNRDLMLQPDGTITLRLLGQVKATGLTVTQLTESLEKAYTRFYKVPAITVTPLKVNSKLEDLRATVDRRMGLGGQSQLVRVTPEGSIALPALGSVPAQGLTLPELQQELNERYRQQVEGIEVIPVLVQRAPRYVYVLGEVRTPGRFELTGPTTALQALSLAGSWNVGANRRQIVVLRRGDDWRLCGTVIDLQEALRGKTTCPADDIWLADSDIVIVPKSPILEIDDAVKLLFTHGVYGVFPMQAALNFSQLSTF